MTYRLCGHQMFRMFHENVGVDTVEQTILEGFLGNNLPKHGISVVIDLRNLSQIDDHY